MGVWTNVLIVLHVMVALAIIGLVLLQHGKGADMGSGFGGGASSSLFGATGSANFLSRSTAVLASLFFILSLTLAYLATNRGGEQPAGGVLDTVRQQQQPANDVPRPQGAAPSTPEAQPQAPAAQPQAEKPAAEAAKPAPEKQVPQ